MAAIVRSFIRMLKSHFVEELTRYDCHAVFYSTVTLYLTQSLLACHAVFNSLLALLHFRKLFSAEEEVNRLKAELSRLGTALNL